MTKDPIDVGTAAHRACRASGRAVTVADAAKILKISAADVRRELRAGAPVVDRGGRGRGRSTLVDPAALAEFRSTRQSGCAPGVLLAIAQEIPQLIAGAIDQAFVESDGQHKRHLAAPLAAAWYLATCSVLDRMRRDAPDIAEPAEIPEKINRLRVILGSSGRLAPSSQRKA